MTVKVIKEPPDLPRQVTCECGAVLEYVAADVCTTGDNDKYIPCPCCKRPAFVLRRTRFQTRAAGTARDASGNDFTCDYSGGG